MKFLRGLNDQKSNIRSHLLLPENESGNDCIKHVAHHLSQFTHHSTPSNLYVYPSTSQTSSWILLTKVKSNSKILVVLIELYVWTHVSLLVIPLFLEIKKQPTISKSSSEDEYRVIASTTCEIVWLMYLMQDLKINLYFKMCKIKLI